MRSRSVGQTPSDVVVLGLEPLLGSEARDRGQGRLRRMRAHQAEHPGEVARGAVLEGRPVFWSEARDLERVAGDHLEVEVDARSGTANDPEDPRKVEESLAQGDLGQEEPLVVFADTHVLDVRGERPGRERLDDVGWVL